MKQTHESAPLLRMAAWACGPTGLVSILTIFYHPPSLPSIPCPSGQPPDWCGWGRGSGGAGLIRPAAPPALSFLTGREGCGRTGGVCVPPLPVHCPVCRRLLCCVFPPLCPRFTPFLLGNVSQHSQVLTRLVNCLLGHYPGKCHFLCSPLTSGPGAATR